MALPRVILAAVSENRWEALELWGSGKGPPFTQLWGHFSRVTPLSLCGVRSCGVGWGLGYISIRPADCLLSRSPPASVACVQDGAVKLHSEGSHSPNSCGCVAFHACKVKLAGTWPERVAQTLCSPRWLSTLKLWPLIISPPAGKWEDQLPGPSCLALPLDAFSQKAKPSLGRGNLWGAQGNVIYGPPLIQLGVRWW